MSNHSKNLPIKLISGGAVKKQNAPFRTTLVISIKNTIDDLENKSQVRVITLRNVVITLNMYG
ncbi:hypothetical protein WG906_09105 [Pedobacter sp. P351]|uniref:hypothetical protein n=1 Tax=Pedobacter superstes TaxID=3133441 RepID=UPI0030A4BF68